MRKTAVLAAALALCACKTVPRQCKAPPLKPRTPSAILAQAKNAVYGGKYQLAVDITSQMLQTAGDPEEADVWAVRGSAYCLMGKKSKARSAWIRANQIDPCVKDISESLARIDEMCRPR